VSDTEILEAPTEVERDANWEAYAHRYGVPPRLVVPLAAMRETSAILRVRRYVEEDFPSGRCLVLTGPTGVGKSLAAAYAIRLTSNTFTGSMARRFFYFPALCGRLLVPHSREESLELVKHTQLIVLDDFGTEYVKEGGLIDAFLDEIVWYREANYKPTIITTNLDTEGLKKRLPARLIDRLRGEWGRIYEVPGESLRA
jgi:DNA replication protein DnaC